LFVMLILESMCIRNLDEWIELGDYLAVRLGYHPVIFRKWEGGALNPRLQNLLNWCDVLGVELTIAEKAKAP
jgi:hypothetical protein